VTRRTTHSSLTTWLLVPLAVARLTRLITSDKLPEMLVLGKWRKAAYAREAEVVEKQFRTDPKSLEDYEPTLPRTAGARFMAGLDCPFCIGFWVGLIVIVISLAVPKPLRTAWNALLGALGLNYVVGHISKRIDG